MPKMPAKQDTEQDTEQTVIRFLNINEVEDAPDLEPIWGNWLFRDSVVLEVGDTGIAKTTLNFSMSKALVDNKPFLSVQAVVPEPMIIYMEFEASKSLVKSRMRAMGGYPNNNEKFKLYIREDEFHTMEQITEAIVQLKWKPDIIFVDPIRMAFNMRDENDNAEATRQMKMAKKIARKFNCCLVLVHHTSKADLSGTRKATGAYSRTSLADVNINFDKLYNSEGQEIDRDLFAMTIPKNRMIDDDFCICLRKIHDGRTFKVVEFPKGARFSVDGLGTATGRYEVQQLILDGILGVNKLQIKHIREGLERLERNVTDQAIYKALNNLIALGLVDCSDAPKNRDYWKVIKNKPAQT